MNRAVKLILAVIVLSAPVGIGFVLLVRETSVVAGEVVVGLLPAILVSVIAWWRIESQGDYPESEVIDLRTGKAQQRKGSRPSSASGTKSGTVSTPEAAVGQ